MKLYLAIYEDLLYPQENRRLGLYRTKEDAEAAIDLHIFYTPVVNQKARFNYSIEEYETFEDVND